MDRLVGGDMSAGEMETAIASGLTFVIKIFEFTYQLKAVGESTKDLLETTTHVTGNIAEARRLRRQKDGLLSQKDIEWMDRAIQDTEIAVRAVARLIEPTRADLQIEHELRFSTRALWVLRDSPKVSYTLARMTNFYQTINTVITCLRILDIASNSTSMSQDDFSGSFITRTPPPLYEMSDLLSSRRRSRFLKRCEMRSPSGTSIASSENDQDRLTAASPTITLSHFERDEGISDFSDWFPQSLFTSAAEMSGLGTGDCERGKMEAGPMFGSPELAQMTKGPMYPESSRKSKRKAWIEYQVSRSLIHAP